MEFLDVIESIRAEEATIGRIFSGEGRPIGGGVRAGRRQPTPEWNRRVLEVATFLGEILSGDRPAYHLQEAMSTSDFPLLFGDVIDRTLLAGFRETPVTWPAYAKRRTVRDFRPAKSYKVDGGEGVLSIVPELDEYPEASLSEDSLQFTVKKYGRKMPFSWEVIVNDDLDALRDIPLRFGRAARRTEEKFAIQLFVDANGPHASLYTAGNKNIINIANGGASNNPALSLTGLQDAFVVLSNQRDADGEPIDIQSVHLVVPPGLEVTANNILNAIQLELTEAGGTAAQKLVAVNWMKNRLQLHVVRYYPIVASTANGQRAWHLFADPGDGRPALEMGFLRGREEPETFIKEPNARRVGGGAVDPLDGSFENDSVEYKVRYVLGGQRVEPRATVASNGSGA